MDDSGGYDKRTDAMTEWSWFRYPNGHHPPLAAMIGMASPSRIQHPAATTTLGVACAATMASLVLPPEPAADITGLEIPNYYLSIYSREVRRVQLTCLLTFADPCTIVIGICTKTGGKDSKYSWAFCNTNVSGAAAIHIRLFLAHLP